MSDAVLEKREKYTPPIEALKPQGENRYLAKVHQNVETKTSTGIFIPGQAQDYPTTGDVISLSPCFDKEKFPDVKPGMCVKVTMNGWSRFVLDGEVYAIGDARNTLAAYDPDEFCQEQ